MEEEIYELLKGKINPDAILDDIAEMVYSAVKAESHMHPQLTVKLQKYRSFAQLAEEYDETTTDEEEIILNELVDLIEQELDEVFDKAEDEVKDTLINGPLADVILADFRKKNVLTVQKRLTEDQVEQMYVGAFRKYDRIKEQLSRKIKQLSPIRAYYRGEEVWNHTRRTENILMDDAELVDEYKKDLHPEVIQNALAQAFYRVIQFNRHYEAEGADEDDEEDDEFLPSDEEEDTENTDSQPEILIEAGDMRDQDYEYVYDLFDEYTGQRVYPMEEENQEAYWKTYGEEFYDLAEQGLTAQLAVTLVRLNETMPEKLQNFIQQYDIDPEDILNPERYVRETLEFQYFYEQLLTHLIDEFGSSKSDVVYQEGKAIQKKMDEKSTEL